LEIEEECFPPSQRYDEEVFMYYYQLHPDLFIVAEVCGIVAGYIIGACIDDMGHVVSLAVHPMYQRRGVGSGLLKILEGKLVEKGVKYIILEVAVSNIPAIKLYRKHGYRIVDVLKNYYGDEDAYLMVKTTYQLTDC